MIHTELREIKEIVITEKVYIEIVNEERRCGVSAGRYSDEETLDGGRFSEGFNGDNPAVPSGIIDHTRIE